MGVFVLAVSAVVAIFLISAMLPVARTMDPVPVLVAEDSMMNCLSRLMVDNKEMYPPNTEFDHMNRTGYHQAYSGVIMKPGESLSSEIYFFARACYAFRRSGGGPGDFCQLTFTSTKGKPENVQCTSNVTYTTGCRNWGKDVTATNTGITDVQFWLETPGDP
jgi:hypothetical protein